MHHDASLNIRQLQVFEAVARLESYSRAQQELGISVSAISNAMSQLEGQLGFTLCQRGRGGFSLTEKGQQFLQQAIRVLSELNELERQSALLKGEHSGTLCISTLDSIETETALSLPVPTDIGRRPCHSFTTSISGNGRTLSSNIALTATVFSCARRCGSKSA